MAGKKGKRGWGWIARQRSGRYLASYVGPDKARHYAPITYTTKLDAEAWLAGERRCVERDEWTPPAERARERWSLGESVAAYGTRWIEQRSLRPRTADLYESQWTRLVESTPLGETPVRAMTPQVVRRWYAELDHDKATQTKQVYSLLKSVMTTAVNDGLLQANPCNLTGKAVVVPKPKQRKLLQPNDVAKIAAADDMPDRYRMMVLLAAWCGLRWGEVSELRRCDVSADGSVVAVTRAVTHRNGRCVIAGTKTDATRTVAVPPHIQHDLLSHLAAHVGDDDEALMFAPFRDGCHVKDRVFSKEWFTPAAKAVGVQNVTFHGLRHFAGTTAVRAGASVIETMKRLGHSTYKAAMIYQHIVDDRDTEVAAALSVLAIGKPTADTEADQAHAPDAETTDGRQSVDGQAHDRATA